MPRELNGTRSEMYAIILVLKVCTSDITFVSVVRKNIQQLSKLYGNFLLIRVCILLDLYPAL